MLWIFCNIMYDLNLIDFVILLPGIGCSVHKSIHICNPHSANVQVTQDTQYLCTMFSMSKSFLLLKSTNASLMG